jgi:hypothetical protein
VIAHKDQLGDFIVTAPESWKDIAEVAKDDGAPFTLAKDAGLGALQFSAAEFKGGENPDITLPVLDRLRRDFSDSKDFQHPFDEFRSDTSLSISAGSYRVGPDYVRVCYCSDGQNVALATYVSDWGREGNEPKECDSIVRGVQFVSRTFK